MALSDNLQFLRTHRGQTQEQLAELLDVSRQSVSKWESGASYPEMDTILKLCGIFHTDMDTLVRGSVEYALAEDTVGYDRFMTRFSLKIAGAVCAIILGAALACLGEGFALPENLTAGTMMLIVAASVVVLVASGMQYDRFANAHPVIADFYTQEERDAFDQRFVWLITAPIGAILLAVAGMAFCADALPERQEMLLCGVFLAVVAVSVFFLIYGGIQKSKYDIEAYNREYSPTPQEKRLQAICSLIMLTAAAMCLGMLIYDRGLIGVCWLTFPIGGILCAIARKLMEERGE